jgi:hypothetical protein
VRWEPENSASVVQYWGDLPAETDDETAARPTAPKKDACRKMENSPAGPALLG